MWWILNWTHGVMSQSTVTAECYRHENLRSYTVDILLQLRSRSTLRNGVSPEDSLAITWWPEPGLYLCNAGRRGGRLVPTGQAVQGRRNIGSAAAWIVLSLADRDVLNSIYAFLDTNLKWIISFTLWLHFPLFSFYFLSYLTLFPSLFWSIPPYLFVYLFLVIRNPLFIISSFPLIFHCLYLFIWFGSG
jgi:hypothetical protein